MGKKTRGRKRPILVNTLGNLLLVMVHTAGWSDLEGGTWLLLGALRHFCTVLKIWVDKHTLLGVLDTTPQGTLIGVPLSN